MYPLHQFVYYTNTAHADLPYRIDDGKRDVWIRVVPTRDQSGPTRQDGPAREQGLTDAVTGHAVIRIQVQQVGDAREPFVPVAEIRFECQIEIDQEALHCDPVAAGVF